MAIKLVNSTAGYATLASPQLITGVKTFPPMTLLMRGADGVTTAEPYSDINAPQTLEMTENALATVATPPSGRMTLYTDDGSSLKIKDDSGVTRTVGSGGAAGKDPTDDWKISARWGTVAAFTPTASTALTLTVGGTTWAPDGTNVANGDRVLVKNQAAPAQNGIYVVSGVGTSVLLTRSADADDITELTGGCTIEVTRGTANMDTVWSNAADTPTVMGTSPVYWTKVAPSYTPGNFKNPWLPVANNTTMENMSRTAIGATAVTPTSGQTMLVGGGVIPAGKVATGVTTYTIAAGATFTVRWVAIVRQSDRAVLAVSTNITSVYSAAGFNAQNFVTAYTATVDTPVWVAIATTATTVPTFGGATGQAGANGGGGGNGLLVGNSSTAPTTTPPTVGTILGAPGSGLAGLPWVGLY